MNKKYFSLLLTTVFMCGTFVFGQKNIVILHTNDTHSRIEPIPESDRFAGNKGGVVRRMKFIEQVRQENKNVLLFDAGDFLQGTPYFNLFKGEVETEAMNLMRYDAATLGNHEFDYGLDLLEQVVRRAEFPIISSNYDFSGTGLENLIKPYLILKKEGVKIGVIAIDVQPKGLIASDNYKGMKFLQPEKTANELAFKLKTADRCDMVICLSHLGYTADKKLAEQTRNIDIIIGGHSHTNMKTPDILKNIDNKDVLIFQTAGRGIYVGRIDVEVEKVKK
ncbi:MAG TPA: bifunctional metallophosphatase/5'-nucleotidase [Petrimonas sp.]|uniref:bifunctional metallophosphatase/5'-nucleotidase n=1 Tax=Petrimonas sp. TaxID=2023866 RepID=UPI0017560E36|nr:metallophosphatase [Petrimonas sp.]MEA4981004.1 metallophosphatase [Petrimonas sp.]MEA5043163.1 metallophosphatase [Petrimonas sp.]MEA5062005.1 metallophosphatase [Petrimonas sp.]HHV84669.1 bifunctional metallophosphatase/5'-nucleotidase [Petrimonas sp.]